MPKAKLDGMGQYWDLNFRLKDVRKYLSDKVQQARRIVYKLGQAVAGAGVNGVLKPTSLVPTIVSALLHSQLIISDSIWYRMRSLSGSEKILTFPG